MSRIYGLHDILADRLESKTELRGVPILSLEEPGYHASLADYLARVRGVAVAIGNPTGTAAATNVPGGQFEATIRAYIFENPELNRERTLFATVADQAARLALVGVSLGERVRQTDTGEDYFLFATPSSSAASWGVVMPATRILELVIRSLQLFTPATQYQTIVCQGFEPGTAEDLADYVARFSTRIGLDPAAVT